MQDSSSKSLYPVRQGAVILKALAFFVPIACIVCLLLWRIYAVQRQLQLETLVQDESARLLLHADGVTTQVQQAVQDLLFLEDLQLPSRYLESPSPETRAELEDIFLSLARSGRYDQIRLLDASGMEIVRVNFNDGMPGSVPPDKLQDKSGRYYFEDTMALPPNQVFISPLDLNVEHGEIEQPFKPMLRLGAPVYGELGEKAGCLVLNMLARKMLAGLASNAMSGRLMLMNMDGYWLRGPAPDEEWGFMFPERPEMVAMRFQERFPQVWKYALERTTTQQLTADGLFCTRVVRPLSVGQWSSSGAAATKAASGAGVSPSGYFWVLASHVPMEQLRSMLPSPWRFLLFGGALTLLFAAGSYLLSLFHGHLSSAFGHLKSSYASLQEAEGRLRERESFYRALFENNLAMLLLVSPEDGSLHQANTAAADFYGYELSEFEKLSLPGLDVRRDQEVLAELQEAAAKSSVRLFATHVLKDQDRREMELYIGPVQHDGRTLLFCILHDVTEQRRAERDLREREQLLSTISNAAQDAIIMIGPDDTAMFWNPAAERMFGHSAQDVGSTSLHALLTPERDRQRALQAMQHFAKTGEGPIVDTLAEMVALKKDGTEFPVEISVSRLRLRHGWGAVASVRDITERKEFEEKLHVLATTDPLTGLLNRREFLDTAEREIRRAKRHQQGLALLMLDVDHFKFVNDSYGHEAGDKVLQHLAQVCLETLRAEDACARIGGEEFAMVVTETDRDGALRAAERLRRGIEQSQVRHDGKAISITVSIGVALAFEHDASTVPALLNQADAALYRAKARGRNCVELA